jgi:hypothetical protein
MPILTNSDRSVLKATYVPLKAPAAGAEADSGSSGSALAKSNFARNLRLQSGEVDQVRSTAGAADVVAVPDSVWQALKQFEPQPLPILAAKASTLASLPADQLLAAGRAIATARTQQVQSAQTGPGSNPSGGGGGGTPVSPSPFPATRTGPAIKPPAVPAVAATAPASAQPQASMSGGGAVNAAALPMAIQQLNSVALALSAVTSAIGAINAFENSVRATPVGMLHLERVEMVPAGIERGELVATIPLAPSETTSVEQKEWSVTSEEFSSIVTDSLENYSEKGVTEKTDLSQSTDSQTKHSQQLGLNASVSGSYGFITFSTSANFNSSSEDDESKKASRDHATEVTQKASTRVRQEHKVTIQTSSVTGTSETSTRTITNPSATDTMRIDYFSMMRKWRVRLLRYGVRMTYDLAIPEPGATLRALHAQLADMNAQLGSPFIFGLNPPDIKYRPDDSGDPAYYLTLAAQYGAAVPSPPQQPPSQRVGGAVQGLGKLGDDEAWHFFELPISIPDGCYIASVWLDAMIGNVANSPWRNFVVFGYGQPPGLGTLNKASFVEDLSGYGGFLQGTSGNQKIVYFLQNVDAAAVTFLLTFAVSDTAIAAWQANAWQALYNAARDTYFTQLQAITQKRDALKAEIENVDTLTLRREEREEIMKSVLRWLLGPEFDFMPKDVRNLFYSQGPNLNVQEFVEKMGEWFVSDDTHLKPTDWSVMYSYGEMVKFIMEAVEWENLLYILYPYFWDIPLAWDFVRRLQHPDPTREEFVRAGSARVVLTIRPGWEDDFLGFLENGEFGKLNHPYMSISDEMRAYADTNYPGIPPANPETSVRPLLTPSQRKAWQDMQGLIDMLNQYYNDNNQTYPTTGQGLAALSKYGTIPSKDPWGNPYVYVSPGQYNDYDLSSLGADGVAGGDGENGDVTSWASASLIGEWYEYTPSHGLDIAIASSLPQIA